jgi:hypothetical protein
MILQIQTVVSLKRTSLAKDDRDTVDRLTAARRYCANGWRASDGALCRKVERGGGILEG